VTPTRLTDPEPEEEPSRAHRSCGTPDRRTDGVVHAVPVQVHLVVRRASRTPSTSPTASRTCAVILNLQTADQELSKRLIDFTSGLTYALEGGMQRVADKVFLLTPRNVEVSAEERARMAERGFFNQA
jgi:cell division inhibitor SepF